LDLDSLSESLRQCSYPDQLLHIDRGILGAGFYPGARGYDCRLSPIDGVMLLGRDFGTKDYYDGLCGVPARDETALTWRHTRDIYLAILAGISVWCTNYLMGVRKNGSATGNIKDQIDPLVWPSFEGCCWQILQAQVMLQRPRVIVVFGRFNREDLTIPDRFGLPATDPFTFTFQDEESEHRALVTFADHPHSLIPNSSKEAARIKGREIKALYEAKLERR
jgi:hypothetical protein